MRLSLLPQLMLALLLFSMPSHGLLGQEADSVKPSTGRLSPTPVKIHSDQGYCGAAAVEFVSRRLGLEAVQGDHFQRLHTPVTVINDSDQELDLQLLTLSCGCMSTDFRPTKVPAGEKYQFHIAVFNPALGDGWQNGTIQTDSEVAPELEFQVFYRIEPSTYLFPDTYLVTRDWLKDKSWPLQVEFEIMALDAEIPLIKPLYLEPDGQRPYHSPIRYSIPETMVLKPDTNLVIQMERGEFTGGHVSDGFVVVAEGKDETLRFPIAISGTFPVDVAQP